MGRNATLIISQPGLRTRRVEIAGGVTSIGRAAGNAVCLKEDSGVSRFHAVIAARGDGFWLSDLGTRNGTTVNDRPVEAERKLNDGDLICVGGASTIEFCSPAVQESDAGSAAAAQREAGPSVTKEEEPSAAAPPPAVEPSGGSSLITVMGAVGGLALTALVVVVLFATGVIGGKKSGRRVSGAAPPPQRTEPTPFVAAGGGDPPAPATPEPTGTIEVKKVSGVDVQPSPAAGADALAGAAQVLAAKISPKNYRIDPAFAALIGSYVNEYRGAAGYFARARAYRDSIDREFVNVQGLPPLFGYVTAMSRSKFVEGGGGVWRLPASVARGEAGGASEAGRGNDAAGSTKAAAAYIRGLWDIFGREGFMYAVACYGMSADEAGEVQQQLELKDPTGQARYDFWRMKNAGVVKGEQVERVARFFAAGIVAENPQQFGLDEQPLSSLY